MVEGCGAADSCLSCRFEHVAYDMLDVREEFVGFGVELESWRVLR